MPSLLEILDCGRTKQVAAHPRHHEHIRPAQPGRSRLVSPLAAESEVEFLAEDGFARLGKAVGKSGQVNIGAAYHRNARNFSHD